MAKELETLATKSIRTLWASHPQARAFFAALGSVLDDELVVDKAAVRMRWTGGEQMARVCKRYGIDNLPAAGDDERLRRIGAGFDLQRLPTMDGAAYERYIDAAWQMRGDGGTANAIKVALTAYAGSDAVYVLEEHEGLTPPGADWAGLLRVVLQPAWLAALGWEPLTLGGNWILGESVLGVYGMSESQLRDVVRLVRKWKHSPSLPTHLVLAWGDAWVLGFGALGTAVMGAESGADVAIEIEIGTVGMLGEQTSWSTLGENWVLDEHYQPIAAEVVNES